MSRTALACFVAALAAFAIAGAIWFRFYGVELIPIGNYGSYLAFNRWTRHVYLCGEGEKDDATDPPSIPGRCYLVVRMPAVAP